MKELIMLDSACPAAGPGGPRRRRSARLESWLRMRPSHVTLCFVRAQFPGESKFSFKSCIWLVSWHILKTYLVLKVNMMYFWVFLSKKNGCITFIFVRIVEFAGFHPTHTTHYQNGDQPNNWAPIFILPSKLKYFADLSELEVKWEDSNIIPVNHFNRIFTLISINLSDNFVLFCRLHCCCCVSPNIWSQ